MDVLYRASGGAIWFRHLQSARPARVSDTMPHLPNDISVYLDDDMIHDLVTSFSDLLRRNRELRPWLDATVGNRWYDFEQDFTLLLTETLWDFGQRTAPEQSLFIDARHPTEAEIELICDQFVEACLIAAPLHSAALTAESVDTLVRSMLLPLPV